MNYTIKLLGPAEYESTVVYQDGKETRTQKSLDLAERYLIESAWTWNHTKITTEDITYLEPKYPGVKLLMVDRPYKAPRKKK